MLTTVSQCLDTGADFPEASDDATSMALAFGQTLVELLRSWPEPVIPVNIHSKCAQVTSRDEAFEVRRNEVFFDLYLRLTYYVITSSFWTSCRMELPT